MRFEACALRYTITILTKGCTKHTVLNVMSCGLRGWGLSLTILLLQLREKADRNAFCRGLLAVNFTVFVLWVQDLRDFSGSGLWGLPRGSIVVPFWGSYLVSPKRNHYGAYGYGRDRRSSTQVLDPLRGLGLYWA